MARSSNITLVYDNRPSSWRRVSGHVGTPYRGLTLHSTGDAAEAHHRRRLLTRSHEAASAFVAARSKVESDIFDSDSSHIASTHYSRNHGHGSLILPPDQPADLGPQHGANACSMYTTRQGRGKPVPRLRWLLSRPGCRARLKHRPTRRGRWLRPQAPGPVPPCRFTASSSAC